MATPARSGGILIIYNGVEAQLCRDGEPIDAPALLPYHSAHGWQPYDLLRLLGRFIDLTPTPIVDVASLTRRLAIRTADLRDRLLWLLDRDDEPATLAQGSFNAWQRRVYAHASPPDFADGISRVIAYGMMLAVLTQPDADQDGDGLVTVAEARAAIRVSSPVLAAAFAPLIDRPVLAEAVRVELGALETLVSAVNAARVNASGDRRGDPWLYFYEGFLAVYDPEERRQAGVYSPRSISCRRWPRSPITCWWKDSVAGWGSPTGRSSHWIPRPAQARSRWR